MGSRDRFDGVNLVGHTITVRSLLMDITTMSCLHKSSNNIIRVWATRWMWFMHPSIVHIGYVCSGATIPIYSHVYSSKVDSSAFQSLEDPR